MRRVFVTGAAGRLGRSIATYLAGRGDEVVGVDLHVPAIGEGSSGAPGPDDAGKADEGEPADDGHVGIAGVRWVAGDLTDLEATGDLLARESPDAVVHLAAIAVPFSRPEPEILATNTALAFNVHQAALDAGVGTVVTASSPTVIGYGAPTGWAPSYVPIDEEHPVRPWMAYSLSKLVAEQTARTFAAQAGDRLRTAAFRPCYVIAPEEWEGAPTQQGHTVQERLDDPALAAPALFNYVDARDAAAFVGVLLDGIRDVPNGDVFFVGADDSLARAPIAELLPQFHPGTAAAVRGLADDAPVFSCDKAARLLGWRPRRSWRTELGRASRSDMRS